MTREDFKKLTMEVIGQQKFEDGVLFDSDNIDYFEIAQYYYDERNAEATMPLKDFLDELYDKIFSLSPQHKEGDKVRIRRDLKVDYDNEIVEEMVGLAGKTATIEEVDTDGTTKLYYKIDTDNGDYWWSDECFE